MNTRIEYLYRDAHNYKTFGEAVLRGALSPEEVQPCYHEKTWFLPEEVGLDGLQEHPTTSADHVWHEIIALQPTPEPPTTPLTAHAFLQRMKAAANARWDTPAVRQRMMEIACGE
ncbi:MAG: hypothetical protein KF886_07930 [Candidatus Hydrogenedentes bacterium]|nr:hypothetical protein [Candidatus Hydrogenedentota bacterium]